MNEYIFRDAVNKDIPFLADTVIAAEKSNSDKLGFSTLFNLSEEEVKGFLVAIFEEEIDGCELSVSSYMVAEYDGKPVAAFSAWVENFGAEGKPSKLLKSNLIGYTFNRESIEFLKTKSHLIKDIIVEREGNAMQLEYLYVAEGHRGNKLGDGLIDALIKRSMSQFPALQKVQVQVFKNNNAAIRLYERNGFSVAKALKSNEPSIVEYLPFDEKYIMEKKL